MISRRRFIQTCSMGAMIFPSLVKKLFASDSARPNIVLVCIDTLRADHLSHNGYVRNTSPVLTDLSGTAYNFTQAYSSAGWTMPAYASLLTGQYAFNHGFHTGVDRFSRTLFLPKLLKDAGYRTVSIQCNEYVTLMDSYFDERHYIPNGMHEEGNVDFRAISRAMAVLEHNTDSQPLFLFVGLYNPHYFYNTDNRYISKFVQDDLFNFSEPGYVDMNKILPFFDGNANLHYSQMPAHIRDELGAIYDKDGYIHDARIYQAAYDSEIKRTDYELGRLFEKMKEKSCFDDAILIVTADHGENMTEHEPQFQHCQKAYNSLVHVPLLIKLPCQERGVTVETTVRTYDIFPTLFEYLDVDIGREIDGRSFWNLMLNEPDDTDRPVIIFAAMKPENDYIPGYIVGVIFEGFKMIREVKYGKVSYELYDLENDPNEQNPLDDNQTVQYMEEYLSPYFNAGKIPYLY